MLPIFHSDIREFNMMQTQWSGKLNQVLEAPMSSGIILEEVELLSGDNVINHLLGRNMQGWFITDVDSGAVIYRNAPFNSSTLTLNSSAAATVNIFVF